MSDVAPEMANLPATSQRYSNALAERDLLSRHIAQRSRGIRKARRHTILVWLLRFLLPSIGLAAVGGLIFVLNFLPRLDLGIDLGPMTLSFNGSSIMMNDPKLSGFGDGGQSYEVKAESATQSILNPQEISLEGLSADINLKDGAWARVLSATGLYDNDAQTLNLSEEIVLNSSEGYQVRLQQAQVDLKAGTMTSLAPVEVRSETGFMQANQLIVDESGQRLRFTNGVRLTIVPPDSSGRLVVE